MGVSWDKSWVDELDAGEALAGEDDVFWIEFQADVVTMVFEADCADSA